MNQEIMNRIVQGIHDAYKENNRLIWAYHDDEEMIFELWVSMTATEVTQSNKKSFRDYQNEFHKKVDNIVKSNLPIKGSSFIEKDMVQPPEKDIVLATWYLKFNLENLH